MTGGRVIGQQSAGAPASATPAPAANPPAPDSSIRYQGRSGPVWGQFRQVNDDGSYRVESGPYRKMLAVMPEDVLETHNDHGARVDAHYGGQRSRPRPGR